MTKNSIEFVLDNKLVELNFDGLNSIMPTTTLLNYLRSLPNHKGVKEGCAQGDCGACTVVICELSSENKLVYKTVDSCLVFLPMIHGKQIITIENLEHKEANKTILHPVQQKLVENHGSQCGYCTPGIVMSMFGLYKSGKEVNISTAEDAITGNLCRCTGYKPIVDSATGVCANITTDHFTENEGLIKELLFNISQKNEPIVLNHSKQKYIIPFTLEDAFKYRKEYSEAVIVNGATDIALIQTKKNEIISTIIDISQISELKHIKLKENSICIGSGVTIENLKSAIESYYPSFKGILEVFGSLQIRNLATIGGNIASASPIGDALPFLFVTKAIIETQNLNQTRYIPIHDFITDYRKTSLLKDELITNIIIPNLSDDSIVKSYKISRRKDLDISTLSAAFRLKLNNDGTVDKIFIAYGGMAAITKRATKTEEFLVNKKWERKTIEVAMSILRLEFNPISDARGDAYFRTLACGNLLLKFWSETIYQ